MAKLRAAAKVVGLGLRLQGETSTPAQAGDPADTVTKPQVERMISIAVTEAVERFELEGKNLAADKHAFETKLRRDMQGLVSPLVDQGVKHKEQFVHNIHHLNDHEGRMAFLEYTIFKSDKSEDRFEDVLRKLAELTTSTAVDIQALRNDWINHK